jgi:hypothetical protein
MQTVDTLEQQDWGFTFNNDFARVLHRALPERILQDHASTIPSCACCSVLIDPVIRRWNYTPRRVRLSEIRAALASCTLCKLLVQVAERFHNNATADAELVLDRAALRLGEKGPRILRFCSDIG